MSLLCLKCDSRVERSAINSRTFYCPECHEELERNETYRVGRRFFQVETKELKMEKTRIIRKKLKGLRTKQARVMRNKG